MKETVFYNAGCTAAAQQAARCLQHAGVILADSADWNTQHLLLDVPSFRPGSSINPDTLLSSLPKHITVWGGMLDHPALDGYRCVDLLKDEEYLMKNAELTATCTMQLAAAHLQHPWTQLPVLIIGWGRIAKALAPLLQQKGCTVTAAARKESDRKHIQSAGFRAVDLDVMKHMLPEFSMIINTVPASILPADPKNHADTLKIDLASVRGIEGDDVVWARGLPGKYAALRSGELIANTILQKLKEETV